MKKSIYLIIALICISSITKAQTTAMNFNKADCNGNMRNLFADLDAGNAVVLFYYMPSCGSCPPPAQKIQTMANNIMKSYPGKVKAYAFPYQNNTPCSYTKSWVAPPNLSLYIPMDSGEAQVAHYGGFGMPTVVLVGGTNHSVLFSTLSFSTSDTTIMRDKIIALFTGTGINDIKSTEPSFTVYPNPVNGNASVNFTIPESANCNLSIIDITGKQVALIMNEKQSGIVTKQFSTTGLPNGIYFVKLQVNEQSSFHKIIINN